MPAFLFVLFIGLMALGVPVTMAIGASALSVFAMSGFTDALYVLPQQMLEGIDSPSMMSIPFFILAGNLMNAVGVTDRIFSLALVLVGRFRGGLAQVSVIAAAIFSGISGSALADIAGLGAIEVKAMRERGYPAEFAAAVSVASSVMAPIMPPSIAFIVYASMANASVARMFMAGIVPATLLAISLMVCNRIIAGRRGYPREEAMPFDLAVRTVIAGLPALGAPAIILIGTMGGYTTVGEAGILASVYSMLLGFAYRSINLKKVWQAINDTVSVTALIMVIIGFSHFMSWVLAIQQAPQHLAALVLTLTQSPTVLMLLLVAFLLFIGCFIESAPAKLILVPVLLPVIDQFGIDRVQFGVVMTLALALGIAHPPMGVGLFVVTRVSNVSLERVTMAVLPLLIPLLIVLIVVALIPSLSTWLPDLVMGAPS
ncbi:TRAP transporter large permease [Paraburkholderia xenovorans]|jgi:tripartite ATP-independent transporter DctM subunit